MAAMAGGREGQGVEGCYIVCGFRMVAAEGTAGRMCPIARSMTVASLHCSGVRGLSGSAGAVPTRQRCGKARNGRVEAPG